MDTGDCIWVLWWEKNDKCIFKNHQWKDGNVIWFENCQITDRHDKEDLVKTQKRSKKQINLPKKTDRLIYFG